MCNQLKRYMLLLTVLISASANSATQIAAITFDEPDLLVKTDNCGEIRVGGWAFGCQSGGTIKIISENGKMSFSGSYPIATGAMYVWGGYDVSSLNTREVYIQFKAKLPGEKQGLKFLKIFGQREEGKGYANSTFALVSDPGNEGGLTQISFGDGSSIENDTQNVINLNGTYKSWIGRSYGKGAIVETPKNASWLAKNWGYDWHEFKVKVKFNSGDSPETEKADGEYFLSIDNVVYVNAKNLLNRHYLNKPIQRIAFLDWAQNGTKPFEVVLDDIVISTDGFLSSPNPPSSVKIE